MEKKFNKVKLLNKSTIVEEENRTSIPFKNEREESFIKKIINSPVLVEEKDVKKEFDISDNSNEVKFEEENIVLKEDKKEDSFKTIENNENFLISSSVEKKKIMNNNSSKRGFAFKNKLFVFPLALLLLSSIVLNAFLINHINKIDYPITEQQLYSFAEKGINGFSDPLLFKSQYLMNKEELKITDKEELKNFSIDFVKKLYSINAKNSKNIVPNKPLRWVEVIEEEISLDVQKGKILVNVPFYQYDNEKNLLLEILLYPKKLKKIK